MPQQPPITAPSQAMATTQSPAPMAQPTATQLAVVAPGRTNTPGPMVSQGRLVSPAVAVEGQATPDNTGDSKLGTVTSRRDLVSLGSQSTSVPLIPISSTINVKPPVAVTFNSFTDGRPTITGGAAASSGSYLLTPAITKLPTFELASSGPGGASLLPENGRVINKRKLIELVNTMGVDEGDGKTQIDGNVEEVLLDLADEFIASVTGFACRLAKHRKANAIDAKDVQLHLERNWNIRVPGYAMDKIRLTRKLTPANSYNQKVQGVEIAKLVSEHM